MHPILGNHFGHHKEKAAPAEKVKVKTRGDVASEIIDAKHHELTQPQVEHPDNQLVLLGGSVSAYPSVSLHSNQRL